MAQTYDGAAVLAGEFSGSICCIAAPQQRVANARECTIYFHQLSALTVFILRTTLLKGFSEITTYGGSNNMKFYFTSCEH